MGPAVANVHDIVMVLGVALEREIEMWEEGMDDVALNVELATSGLHEIAAGGGDSGFNGELNMGSLGLGAVSLFVSGPGGWVAGAGSLGLGVLATLGVGAGSPGSGATGPGIIAALGETLDGLNTSITEYENKLNTNLRENLDKVYGTPGACNIVSPTEFLDNTDAVDIFGGENRALEVDGEKVRDITDIFMNDIAIELNRAAGSVADASLGYVPWSRSTQLGLGAFGPADAWMEMHGLIEPFLQDLHWEVEESAQHLALAVNELQALDDEVAGTLEGHTKRIEDGSGIDPTPRRPEPEPPRRGGDQPVTSP